MNDEPWAELTVDDAELVLLALQLLAQRMSAERSSVAAHHLAHLMAGQHIAARAKVLIARFERSIANYRDEEENT